MFLKRLTFGDEARNKKHLSKTQKLCKKEVKLLLNDGVSFLKKSINLFWPMNVGKWAFQKVPF